VTGNCDEGNGRDWKESDIWRNKFWFNGGNNLVHICFFFWRNRPQWTRPSSFTRFLDHTQWRTTLGRTRLDEWSARRRNIYLTKHNIYSRQTCTRWIRTHNLSSQAVVGPRPRPRGHWDRPLVPIEYTMYKTKRVFFRRTQLVFLIQTWLNVSSDDCYRMLVDIDRNT